MNTNLQHDLAAIPFSRWGSYLAISRRQPGPHLRADLPAGIWLRTVHGASAYEVIHLELVEAGQAVTARVSGSASVLSLHGEKGRVDLCMPTADTLRIRVRHATLRMTVATFRNHCAIPEPNGHWMLSVSNSFRFYRLIPLAGEFTFDAPWTTKRCTHMIGELAASGDQAAELAIEEITWMRHAGPHSESFDDLAAGVQREFEAFRKPYLDCPAHLKVAATQAAYLDWSSVVAPHLLITRPAMFMSKNWMTNVWAWDHAFNAWAVSLSAPDLAWDQFMVIFDHQAKNGQIPDYLNDLKLLTTFVKPPIHGWILSRMIDIMGDLPIDRLKVAYEKLSRWTDWWFAFRDPDGDGLPVYWHGNDSGWDNATVFDVPLPLKSADLSAFLVVQMDVLAGFADRLGRGAEAVEWRKRADRTLAAMIEKLWDGQRFKSISTVTRQSAQSSDSVFGCLPIILGQRLPQPIRKTLAAEIQRHTTPWGPATEHPQSPAYQPDGYWRGPIWAPSTMILIDGLRSAGEAGQARELAQRFCNLCAQHGFAENFDALTGAPLRDGGYTWTSSVFLVLANRYI